MCNGFGCIATQDGRILFMEPDENGNVSHSDILHRAEIKENNSAIIRNFVRVEFPDWTEKSFRWDERSTLPGWADSAVEERCKKLLLRISPLYAEYRTTTDQAEAEYHKTNDPAWAEYRKTTDQAEAEYHKTNDQALDEYRKTTDQAEAEYHKIMHQAETEFVVKISAITGYLSKQSTAVITE